MSRWQHEFLQLSLSLSLSLSHQSLPADVPNYILWVHRADVNKFLLVGQQWPVDV